MALASGAAEQLGYIEEATPGVTPTTGTPKALRMTNENLNFSVESVASKEVNSTRQTRDSVQVGASAGGGFNFELSYREYDTLLEALLANTFGTFGTGGRKSGLTLTINKTARTITGSSGDFTGLVAGQWFRLETPGNTGYYRAETVTSSVITVDSDTPLSANETSVSGTVSSTRLTNGTDALRFFSLEKVFTDVGQYFIYRGMSPAKLTLNFATKQIVTGTWDFLGMGSAQASSTMLPGALSPSYSYGVMNSVAGVGSILINGDTALLGGAYVRSMTLELDAALRGQEAIGYKGFVGVSPGTFNFGGSLEVYLADGSLYNQALQDNLLSIEFPVVDVDGNGYAFIMNNVKLAVPEVSGGGTDADVVMNFRFTAVAPDISTDKMLIVDRFGAAIS